MNVIVIILGCVSAAEFVLLIIGVIRLSRQGEVAQRGNERAMRYLKLTNAMSKDDPALIRLDKQIIMAKTLEAARLVRGDLAAVAERLEV